MNDINRQIEADLDAVFFGEGGIGVVEAVYRSADGMALRGIRGAFDREHLAVPGEFADTAARKTTFTTRAAYWPETFRPQVGGTLEVQVDPETVTTYAVRGLEPDGTGVVVLVLEGP
ncbi:MAG: hypothetical protein OEY97_13955 [Nitrospirota bacterium]|nr:hypothetical protein [Nitrospirota bacterium]